MNQLQVFNNEMFGQVRVSMLNGEPWFVASDVCKALAISNAGQAVGRLDKDEKMTIRLNDSHSGQRGGARLISLVNETGLYTLVLGSRKPGAKEFKRWITHDILPTIRKTGGYVANEAMFIETYLSHTDDATKALFSSTLQTIQKQNQQLEVQRPLVEFAETVQKSKDNILIGTLAKLMCDNGTKIGGKRLFKLLRDENILMENNVPYQSYIDQGYFHVKEGYHRMRSGEVELNFTTLVTPRGQVWAMKRVRKALNAKHQ